MALQSGEIFSNKSKKKSTKAIIVRVALAILLCVLLALFGYWSYLSFEQQQTSLNNSLQPVLKQQLNPVELAQQRSTLLKSLSINIDSEVVDVETPLTIEKSEQGFTVSSRLRLAFFNHSELYVKVSDIQADVTKQADHSYAVDISLLQEQKQSVVVPPLAKAYVDLYFSADAECLLKSFAASWQYQYEIDHASLDFIFQQNQALRKQVELATKHVAKGSQIIINHSDLKSVQERTKDFCQYEI